MADMLNGMADMQPSRGGRPLENPELGKVRSRVIRVDDPTWDAAVARAAADGISLAAVVRHYLREYGAGAADVDG